MDKSKIIEAAQQYTLRGQLSKAIEEWKKLLTDTGGDAGIYNTIGDLHLRNHEPSEAVEAYLRAGEVFHGSGFIAKAIAVYQKLLKIDPNRKDIYLYLAEMNVERGMVGNARENYLKAARFCTQGGMIRESLEIFRKIADLDPHNLSVRLKIAEACLKEGLHEEAIAEYLKIAEAHVQKGEMVEAESVYRQIVSVDPGNQKALLEIGRFHLTGEHFEVALGYAEKILEENPDSADALSLLQEIHSRMGQYDKAEDVVQKLIALEPHHLPYQEMLAAIALHKKNFPLAEETLVAVGSVYNGRGEYRKAIENLKPLLEQGPASMQVLEILFHAHVGIEDKDQIITLGLQLAQEYDHASESEKARATYIKILEWDPQNEEAEREIRRLSPPEAASETVEDHQHDASSASWAVKGSREEKVGEHMNASLVYLKYGLIEKAVNELREALTLDPKNEKIYLRLKEVYLHHQPEKAAEACFSLSTIYEEKGEIEQAVSVLREGLEIAPEHPQMMSRLQELDAFPGEKDLEVPQNSSGTEEIKEMWEEASFYAQQGMAEEAIRVCQQILTNQPGHREATSLLQRMQGQGGAKSPTIDPETGTQETVLTLESQEVSDSQEVPLEVLEEVSQVAEGFFDLEAALQESTPTEPAGISGETRSFEDIFQEFQKGIRSKFGEEDYETHYNLGVAYREMGLLEEAAEEFQLSIRSSERYFDSAHMLAECYRETGRDRQALETLDQAISHPGYMDSRHKILKYEKGLLLEKTNVEQALNIYYDLYNTDPTYRDIGERILRLKKIPSG